MTELQAAIERMNFCRAGCDVGDPFYADVYAWDVIRGAIEWQPIETAPKDKAVLVVTGGRAVTVGWYRNHVGPKASKWQAWSGVINPTHWMPLPEPPSAA